MSEEEMRSVLIRLMREIVTGEVGSANWDAAVVGFASSVSSMRQAKSAPSSSGSGSGIRMAFGKQKGATPDQLTDRDLNWYMGCVARNIEDPSKERWRDSNQSLLDALTEELLKRGGNGDDVNDEIPF